MFDDLIAQNVAEWGIPESWLRATIETESNWNPNAYRAEPQIGDASYGLGQILFKTAQGLGYTGEAEGLFDPATNLYYTSSLIAQIRAKVGDDAQAFYSAYNSGSSQLYKSSTEVAAHVARFMGILSSTIAALASAVSDNPETSGGIIIVLILAAWFFFKRGA